MSFISKKYIRNAFKTCNMQINEEAVDAISEKLKIQVGSYTLNARDLGYKRITKEKVPIIIGDYDAD